MIERAFACKRSSPIGRYRRWHDFRFIIAHRSTNRKRHVVAFSFFSSAFWRTWYSRNDIHYRVSRIAYRVSNHQTLDQITEEKECIFGRLFVLRILCSDSDECQFVFAETLTHTIHLWPIDFCVWADGMTFVPTYHTLRLRSERKLYENHCKMVLTEAFRLHTVRLHKNKQKNEVKCCSRSNARRLTICFRNRSMTLPSKSYSIPAQQFTAPLPSLLSFTILFPLRRFLFFIIDFFFFLFFPLPSSLSSCISLLVSGIEYAIVKIEKRK